MFLTGYHGTTLTSANKILEGEFNISSSETEWLGDGIYFYFSISDAYAWRNTEVILHSVIKIDDEEYLDIDSDTGKQIFSSICDLIAKAQGKVVSQNDIQKNQCAVMRILWDAYPKLKVVSASFPTERSKVRTLVDPRGKRKEFCVRNNDCIKHTYLIRKGDLDD